MKKLIFLLCATILLSTIISSCGNSISNKTEQTTNENYSCPMHPEITGDKPGTCPKCGMDLEKVESTMTDSTQ